MYVRHYLHSKQSDKRVACGRTINSKSKWLTELAYVNMSLIDTMLIVNTLWK